MMFVPSVRADKVRPDVIARPLFAYAPAIDAKLIDRFDIIGLLASHYFPLIHRHYFAMRCFHRPRGEPRETNTRGGES